MFYVLPWDLILCKHSWSLFNVFFYDDILWPVIKGYKNSLVLNSDIQDSLRKFSLLFRQAEMVFVIVWCLDHFTLESVPSMNSIWIITFVSHHHVWVTKFKPSLIFFKLSILTLNNTIWVGLFTVLFDEAQHVVRTSTMGYVPVC